MTDKAKASREKKAHVTTKVGRPTEYDPAFATQAEKLCRLGATMEQLAEFLAVDVRTIYRWKNQHVEFCQSIKVGAAAADDMVERSLYERALGYDVTETVVEYELREVTLPSGETSTTRVPVRERVKTRHVPPDVTAQMFWLKNRKPEQWRENYERPVERERDLEKLVSNLFLSLKANGYMKKSVTPNADKPQVIDAFPDKPSTT